MTDDVDFWVAYVLMDEFEVPRYAYVGDADLREIDRCPRYRRGRWDIPTGRQQ